MVNHKHKGVERSNGSLRPHPISRQHKDSQAKRYHNAVLTPSQKNNFKQFSKPVKKTSTRKVSRAKPKAKTVTKSKIGAFFGKLTKKTGEVKKITGRHKDKKIIIKLVKYQEVGVDEEGWLVIDIDKMPQKGIRIIRQERKNRTERTVGIQIPKGIKLFE